MVVRPTPDLSASSFWLIRAREAILLQALEQKGYNVLIADIIVPVHVVIYCYFFANIQINIYI